MKKFYTTLLFLFSFFANAQNLSLRDLVSSASYTEASFSQFISKKGYKPDEGHTYTYAKKKSKSCSAPVSVQRYDKLDCNVLSYYTEDDEDVRQLKNQLQKEGFVLTKGENEEIFCKGLFKVSYLLKHKEDKKLHHFLIERKQLPSAHNYIYAEDLLQLTSHEYIASVFGPDNVRKETFYYSESDTNKCSVLFPNTNMQVIFIWNDEANSKDIAFIIVGGELKASPPSQKRTGQNKWKSKQGVHIGMSLQELQQENGAPLHFYNWNTEQPGVVVDKNKGKLNLDELSVVLNNLDTEVAKGEEVLNSATALKQADRIYISTLIVLPPKPTAISKVH